MDLLDSLREALRTPDFVLQSGDHILAAVSGGPDSLSLLHALHALRSELGLRGLGAAHFHHGLRGQEADDDAAFVAQFCAARGIPCFTEKADIAALAAQRHVSLQQAARDARYAFLARAAQHCGADKVATAHTQDDQVETVLLHILRGTGLDGLRGIPARRGIYVRPMLGITRAQVEEYCAAHALSPRRDSSNSDLSHYTRNRVRHELLPLLEAQYHAGARGSLLRLSQIAGADADFLHLHAQATLREVTLDQKVSPPGLSLSRAGLRALHPALLRHVLRAALAFVRGTTEGVTSRHLAQIADALLSSAQTSWGMTTPAPICRIHARADVVTVTWQDDCPAETTSSYSIPLALGHSVKMPGEHWSVRAELSAVPAALPPARLQASFDARQVHLPSLHVRLWRPGDRIATRGLGGHTQKLQNVFINAKVPQGSRAHVPIVADRDGLLWVAGLAASERGRLTPETRQKLVLTAFQSQPQD